MLALPLQLLANGCPGHCALKSTASATAEHDCCPPDDSRPDLSEQWQCDCGHSVGSTVLIHKINGVVVAVVSSPRNPDGTLILPADPYAELLRPPQD